MQNEIHYAEKKELNKKATSEVRIPNNFLRHTFMRIDLMFWPYYVENIRSTTFFQPDSTWPNFERSCRMIALHQIKLTAY